MSDDGLYTVPEGIRRMRADKALASALPEHSRTAWQRAFDAGLVRRGDVVLAGSAFGKVRAMLNDRVTTTVHVAAQPLSGRVLGAGQE